MGFFGFKSSKEVEEEKREAAALAAEQEGCDFSEFHAGSFPFV